MDFSGTWISPLLQLVMFIEIILDSIRLVIIMSCVPLLVIGLTGMLFSFLQSCLQIQEQTVGHMVRLLAFAFCAYFFASVCCGLCLHFTEEVFTLLPQLGRRD